MGKNGNYLGKFGLSLVGGVNCSGCRDNWVCYCLLLKIIEMFSRYGIKGLILRRNYDWTGNWTGNLRHLVNCGAGVQTAAQRYLLQRRSIYCGAGVFTEAPGLSLSLPGRRCR